MLWIQLCISFHIRVSKHVVTDKFTKHLSKTKTVDEYCTREMLFSWNSPFYWRHKDLFFPNLFNLNVCYLGWQTLDKPSLMHVRIFVCSVGILLSYNHTSSLDECCSIQTLVYEYCVQQSNHQDGGLHDVASRCCHSWGKGSCLVVRLSRRRLEALWQLLLPNRHITQ